MTVEEFDQIVVITERTAIALIAAIVYARGGISKSDAVMDAREIFQETLRQSKGVRR